MSRTRAAPTPTNISTNSEPLIEKNGTPASPATARGLARHRPRQQGLARPGRPDDQHAFRDAAPEAPVALRILEEFDDLHQLVARLVDAGHVVETHAGLALHVDTGPALAHIKQPGRNATPLRHGTPHPEQQEQRQRPRQQRTQPFTVLLAEVAHVRRVEVLDEIRIGHADGVERTQPIRIALDGLGAVAGQDGVEAAGLERPRHGRLRQRDLVDLAAVQELLELAVRQRRRRDHVRHRLEQHEQDDGEQPVPQHGTERRAAAVHAPPGWRLLRIGHIVHAASLRLSSVSLSSFSA